MARPLKYSYSCGTREGYRQYILNNARPYGRYLFSWTVPIYRTPRSSAELWDIAHRHCSDFDQFARTVSHTGEQNIVKVTREYMDRAVSTVGLETLFDNARNEIIHEFLTGPDACLRYHPDLHDSARVPPESITFSLEGRNGKHVCLARYDNYYMRYSSDSSMICADFLEGGWLDRTFGFGNRELGRFYKYLVMWNEEITSSKASALIAKQMARLVVHNAELLFAIDRRAAENQSRLDTAYTEVLAAVKGTPSEAYLTTLAKQAGVTPSLVQE